MGGCTTILLLNVFNGKKFIAAIITVHGYVHQVYPKAVSSGKLNMIDKILLGDILSSDSKSYTLYL